MSPEPRDRPMVQIGKAMDYVMMPLQDQYAYDGLISGQRTQYRNAYREYEAAIATGIAKEVARSVLPVAIYSSMYAAANPRSIMAFLSLRTNRPEAAYPSKPQWEIAQCANRVESIFADIWPATYSAYVTNGRVAP
jgi:thymidylate synthase (FAD)